MIVVADTSPLRYLIDWGYQDFLPALFGEVWVPSAVLNEISAPATPESVRVFLERRPEWLRVEDPSPDELSAISAELDYGERAALARHLHADLVLIDDAAGRREAAALRLRITGMVGVLRLAVERELIAAPLVVSRLRQSSFYLKESVILGAFGEWLPKP